MQFVDGIFVESYYPTIENSFSKVMKYKGQEFATEIIDTAGQVSRFMQRNGSSLKLAIAFRRMNIAF